MKSADKSIPTEADSIQTAAFKKNDDEKDFLIKQLEETIKELQQRLISQDVAKESNQAAEKKN